jgi:hypothetical protein
MSLLEELINGPSAADQYLSMAPMLTASGPPKTVSIPGQTGGSSDWERTARDFFINQQGYSPGDWRKVDSIIEQESGWDPNALNESSGAAGIAQNISGFGGNYPQNDPMAQIRWLANYLGSHNYSGYGTGIDAAYQHKQDTGWY